MKESIKPNLHLLSNIKKEKESDEFNSGLNIISPNIYVNETACKIIYYVQNKISGKEISILFKSYWSSYGYVITDEYIIPEQIVDTASVDYKDNGSELYKYRAEGYNTVMHSHPHTGKHINFSKADSEYINSHFPCSILCNSDSEIVRGTLLLKTDNDSNRLRLEIDNNNIFILKELIKDVEGLENIRIAKPKTVVNYVSKSDSQFIGEDEHIINYLETLLDEYPENERELKRMELYEVWGVGDFNKIGGLGC
jgi:hypothetical protein